MSCQYLFFFSFLGQVHPIELWLLILFGPVSTPSTQSFLRLQWIAGAGTFGPHCPLNKEFHPPIYSGLKTALPIFCSVLQHHVPLDWHQQFQLFRCLGTPFGYQMLFNQAFVWQYLLRSIGLNMFFCLHPHWYQHLCEANQYLYRFRPLWSICLLFGRILRLIWCLLLSLKDRSTVYQW